MSCRRLRSAWFVLKLTLKPEQFSLHRHHHSWLIWIPAPGQGLLLKALEMQIPNDQICSCQISWKRTKGPPRLRKKEDVTFVKKKEEKRKMKGFENIGDEKCSSKNLIKVIRFQKWSFISTGAMLIFCLDWLSILDYIFFYPIFAHWACSTLCHGLIIPILMFGTCVLQHIHQSWI